VRSSLSIFALECVVSGGGRIGAGVKHGSFRVLR